MTSLGRHIVANLVRGQALRVLPRPFWQRHATSTHATNTKEYPHSPAVGIGVVILRKKNDLEEVGLSSLTTAADSA